MTGNVWFYVWVCVVGCVTCSGEALPTVLGEELAAEEGEPGMVDWVQGVETPLRHQFWGDVEAEEEEELDNMSPDSDKRQYPGGKRQYPGGKRQYPGGKRQYPGGKRQFVGGETIPSPELRQYPGGKRQYPAGKRQYPGGKRQYPGGKRQYPGGKRQYPGGKRSESDQDLLPMEIRQWPGGKRQWPGGKRQWPGGKRQWPGGKRQYPAGKRQFVGGELMEQESPINKRFAPEDDNLEFIRLAQLYDTNDNVGIDDLLDDIMVDTRPQEETADTLKRTLDPEDALALDLSVLLNERKQMGEW